MFLFKQSQMRLHISWILLMTSVSMSYGELPSDNDDEGKRKLIYFLKV